MKNTQAHISLHVSDARPEGVLVVQPRNTDGTFASPVPAAKADATTFHVADYTARARWVRGRLG